MGHDYSLQSVGAATGRRNKEDTKDLDEDGMTLRKDKVSLMEVCATYQEYSPNCHTDYLGHCHMKSYIFSDYLY